MSKIKVAVVEDNTSVREGLATILDGTAGFKCAGACRSAEEALLEIPRSPPDVVLMDINLPGQSGIECVRQLKEQCPELQILMLTIEEDNERVFQSLEAGASGYLVKHVAPAKILDAIEEIHRGGSPMSSQIARLLVRTFQNRERPRRQQPELTPREQEILGLISKGYRSKDVATALSVSPQTVETHIRNIYEKLHVRSRAEAVARYLRPSEKERNPPP